MEVMLSDSAHPRHLELYKKAPRAVSRKPSELAFAVTRIGRCLGRGINILGMNGRCAKVLEELHVQHSISGWSQLSMSDKKHLGKRGQHWHWKLRSIWKPGSPCSKRGHRTIADRTMERRCILEMPGFGLVWEVIKQNVVDAHTT